ncbi:MAG TPA: 50S ribosomal protein L11 methyltransferase [Gemmatimonadota bacterium]|nr:50S ribosomal protein L11 methyltransferase [Gemmatimonadota bacterium]
MSGLSPDTVLRRAPDVALELYSDNSVRVRLDGRTVGGGSRTLRILDAFAAPRAVADALRELGADVAGAQDWIDLMNTVVQLHRGGVLLRHDALPTRLESNALLGFEASQIHVAMLNDRQRTGKFIEAIRRTVREGDVVVDIGTGTGVLAIAAAQAGARRVYAIEACGIADTARQMFEANGVADRVTLIREQSVRARLPERADVLVSEIIGNEPLGEMVVETMRDAIQRFLAPGGRVVPARLAIHGIPVDVPEDVLDDNVFTEDVVGVWKGRYGIDFGPLRDIARRSPQVTYREAGWRGLARWPRLAEPVRLVEMDFAAIEGTLVDAATEFQAERQGRLSGLIVHFDLDMGDGLRLSTHPDEVDETHSWRYPVWFLGEPFDVRPGDAFRVRYCHGVRSARERVRVTRVESGG